jgi:hypothetical protein
MTRPRSAASWAAVLLVGTAALALLAALVLDLAFGLEVTPIHNANDLVEQAALRRMRDPRDDPAEIYGVPERPLRAVVFDRERLIRPPEAPDRALLPVHRAIGVDVLQARSVWRYALTVAAPALLLALVCWIASRRVPPRDAGVARQGPLAR